jgi:hypothetical protein
VTRWCELVGVINAVLGGPDLASSLLGLPNLIGTLSRATDYANIRQRDGTSVSDAACHARVVDDEAIRVELAGIGVGQPKAIRAESGHEGLQSRERLDSN